MNIRNIIAALALLGLTGAGANAQNRYVSQDAATVLGSDKYYISDFLHLCQKLSKCNLSFAVQYIHQTFR